MSSVLKPNVFQVYCVAAVAFEVPVVVQLLRGEWTLPDAGAWFDNELCYTNNTALKYVFVALLCVLVVGRGIAFVLPNLRMVILYNIALHTAEVLLFLYCVQHKVEEATESVYIIGALMVANVVLLATRFLFLKGQEKKAEMAEIQWRQEQLAIIRKKRGDYAKEKAEKKQN